MIFELTSNHALKGTAAGDVSIL